MLPFDKAHEMFIDKDLKKAIVWPPCEYLSQISSFYQHGAECLHTSLVKCFHQKNSKYQLSKDKKERENVESMLEAIKTGELLPLVTIKSILRNVFNGKIEAGDQRQDLLTFCNVGQKEYERYTTHIHPRSIKQAHHTPA